MAKLRSPNCPQVTFSEAAEKARSIYSKEHTHPADKNVIAEDLGYTSISGASLSTIGALRQYGLLEPAGDGLRISDDAVDYFEGDAPAKLGAAMRMASRPALFRELENEYGKKLPSDASLRHSLIKKGFLPKTAEEVLRVYKENFKLFDNADLGYTNQENAEMTTATAPETSKKANEIKGFPASTEFVAPTNISTPVGKDDQGNAVFAYVRFDSPLRKEFVSGLKKYLDYLESTLQ